MDARHIICSIIRIMDKYHIRMACSKIKPIIACNRNIFRILVPFIVHLCQSSIRRPVIVRNRYYISFTIRSLCGCLPYAFRESHMETLYGRKTATFCPFIPWINSSLASVYLLSILPQIPALLSVHPMKQRKRTCKSAHIIPLTSLPPSFLSLPSALWHFLSLSPPLAVRKERHCFLFLCVFHQPPDFLYSVRQRIHNF